MLPLFCSKGANLTLKWSLVRLLRDMSMLVTYMDPHMVNKVSTIIE